MFCRTRQEAILQFSSRLDVHHIDLVRFPALHHLCRLRVSLEHLDFEHPLGTLSNLPALMEVTVQFTSNSYWRDIEIEDWVRCVGFSAPVSKEDKRRKYVTVEELTRSEWKFDLFLRLEFCGPRLVCGALISKGRLLQMTVKAENEVEWRTAIVDELRLDVEVREEGAVD